LNDLLPLAQFSANVQLKPDAPYLHQPVDGELKTFTWAEVDQQARCIATALLALEVSTGDRIGILSKNCAEWFIADS
jgi:long-chain acyl-CoA synthetase